MVSQSARRDCGSRPVVGSSRNSTSGSPTSAKATARRWRCPPDSFRPRSTASPRAASRPAAFRRERALVIEAPEQAHRFLDRQPVEETRLLQRHADALAQPVRSSMAQVRPSSSTVPDGRRNQALEDLHRGGLPGAVRTEQTEALAATHLQIEPVHRDHVGVLLDQVFDANRGVHGASAQHYSRSGPDTPPPFC